MGRGRKPIPDAVKALRGNPGKRRLQLAEPVEPIEPIEPSAMVPRPPAFEVPDWLTGDRARRIFRQVVEDYLQRRIIRAPDFIVAGRWAHWFDLWLTVKDEPPTTANIDRLIKAESALRPLEDRLGLSPLARQDILRGLAAMPAAIGDMLAEELPRSGSPDGASGVPIPVAESPSSAGTPLVSPLGSLRANPLVSPLGFLKLVQ